MGKTITFRAQPDDSRIAWAGEDAPYYVVKDDGDSDDYYAKAFRTMAEALASVADERWETYSIYEKRRIATIAPRKSTAAEIAEDKRVAEWHAQHCAMLRTKEPMK